jgi:hypothetical protein
MCMPFTNYVVLADKSRTRVNRKLKLCQETLDIIISLSRTKTEYVR